MIVSKKALPRRTMLKGMGAAIALPLLDAMVPAMTALADTPASPTRLRRLGYVYMPMGSDISRWTLPGDDSTQLSPTLSPLAPVRQYVTAITNLELKNAYPGTHATSNAAFLSCAKAKRTESTDYHLATTVDQIAAKQIGQDTQLPSLEMSMELGADINAVDDNGETAMHGAAYKSLPKMVQFLADHGADINVWNTKNKYGWTPLLIAEGHRPGNFKPAAATIAALHRVTLAAGVEPPTEPTPRAPRNRYDYSPGQKKKPAGL